MLHWKSSSRGYLSQAPSPTFGESWDYDHETATNSDFDDDDFIASGRSFDEKPFKNTNPIKVSVTGVSFMIEPLVFDRVKRLPWQWSSAENCLFLPTSPELFEILLNHLIFDSYPIALSRTDIEELEPMAIILGLTKLEAHVRMLLKLKPRIGGTRPPNNSNRRVTETTPKDASATKQPLIQTKASSRHWEKARSFLVHRRNHRKVHDTTILEAECIS